MMRCFKTVAASLVLSIFLPTATYAGSGDFFPNNRSNKRVNGINVNSGIGNSVQFNLIHNQPWLPQVRGHMPWTISDSQRAAYIASNGLGNLDDERDFVTAAKNTDAPRVYKHTLTNLRKGDVIRVFTYVHNNANQGCGGINHARNTTVTVDWSDPRKVVSSIAASNANPQVINDIVDLRLQGGGTFDLEFQRTTVGKRNFPDYYPPGHSLYGTCQTNGNTNWSHQTVSSSRPSAKTARVNLGDVAGSAGNSRVVVMYFKIVDAQPSCQEAEFNKDEVIAGEQVRFTWRTQDLESGSKLVCGGSGTGVNIDETVSANGNKLITIPMSANDGATLRCNIKNPDSRNLCGDTVNIRKPNPSIKIDKDDSTPGTPDNDGHDTQRVEVGGTANFTIKVTNDGETGLKDVLVNDTLAPSCARTVAQALPLIQAIGNRDNIFDPGESFTYACQDTNVTASYTNVAYTEGISTYDDTTKVTDTDPTEVVVGPPAGPDIKIDKDDSTPGTADNDGDDTQVVVPGGTATFTIKVTNTGTEGLRDIVITDAEATDCARTAAQTLPLIQAVENGDNVLSPGNSFSYTCTKENVQTTTFVDGDNDSQVSGVGVGSGTTVTDEDPTEVRVEDAPAIEIDKDDSTPGDPDTDGDDTQRVARGGTAIFTIQVTNTGSEGLKNVRIDDGREPNCARTIAQALPLIQAVGNRDNIFDPGESFTYTCEDTNVTDSYTNTATVTGESVVDDQIVNDTDPTEVVIPGNPTGPSIDIDKDDSTPGTPDSDGHDTQEMPVGGGTATFTIKVTNDGTESLTNVIVTDLLAPDCERTAAQTLPLIQATGNADGIFDSNESFTYVCELENVTSAFTNIARVTGDPVNGDPQVNDEDPSNVTIDTGGGSGDTIPRVGTCTIHPNTGAQQCTNRRPVEDPSDPLWQSYRNCVVGNTEPRNTANTRERSCVLDWAENQDLKLCGANIGGVIDPFASPTSAEIAAQCGTIQPPHPPTPCEPVGDCPECFNVGATINKQVKNNDSGSLVKKITVSKSDIVTYEITVDNLNFDKTAYEILTGKIKVYDMMIPEESGNIWNRHGIIDGDDNATWRWCGKPGNCAEDKDYFERTLTSTEIGDLNNAGFAQYKVHYDMNTALASEKDTSQLKNVAFAVIEYTYRNRATSATGFKRIGIGDNACTPPTLEQYVRSISSLGSSAQVQIIRPFIRAKAGNVGIQSSQAEKVTGKPQTISEIMSDNNLFVPDVLTMDEFDELGNFQNVDNNDFYENLNQNTQTQSAFGNNFRTHEYESGVYFYNGDLDLDSVNIAGLTRSVTFIVENGDLIINSDFNNIPSPHFVAFVVQDGDILIDKNVEEIHGTFLVERGQIKAKNDDISDKQLNVSGNLIGNLAHLLSFRKYIGDTSVAPVDANGFPVPEPSLVVNFDLRLLEATPPILEQFLGTDWREEVQG